MQLHREVRSSFVLLALITVALTAAIGCGDDDDGSSRDPSTGTAGSAARGGSADGDGNGAANGDGDGTAGTSGTSGTSGGGATAGTGGAAGTGDGIASLELTDGQVATVVMVANMGEIEQGQFAMMLASEDDVREYATRMVEEHGAANMRLVTLLADAGINAAPHALSQQLMTESMQILAMLQNRTGMDFDLAYMESQRTVHARVLEIVDMALLPNVESDALRAELEMLRPAIAEHLSDAEEELEDLQESD
jgi:putative membrane protein